MFLLAGGGLLAFDTGFAVWMAVTLIIFLLLMGKYAVPYISDALIEREERIKDSLESAEDALERAEEISEDNQKALREAEVKAQQIRKEAVEEAEMVRAERIENAKEEADQMIEKAREAIEQEKKQAFQELHDEVARLAIESASKIIDAELDKDKNRKLVDDFIDDIQKELNYVNN